MNDVNLAIKGRSEVEIPCSNGIMGGFLTVPDGATSIIIFAHGSGSSRNSPRNNYVAKELNNKKFATLLMDLLVKNEELSINNRFNIKFIFICQCYQKSFNLFNTILL